MRSLGRAALLLAVGLALQLVVPRRADFLPQRLTFLAPTRLLVEADEGGFCSSEWMYYALMRRAVGPLLKGDEPYDGRVDFTVRCRSEKRQVRLLVSDWSGKPVTEVSRPRVRDWITDSNLAHDLSQDPKFIAAAVGVHQRDASRSAEAAAEQWKRGEWRKAADNFFFALESDVNPAPMYYGLYESHAKLGEFDKAYWYLLCFLKASGRAPQQLEERQLAALRDIGAPALLKAAMAAPKVNLELLFALREGMMVSVAWQVRETARTQPWNLPAHDLLIRMYEQRGWTGLAKAWRARRDLAASVEGSVDVTSALLFARLARR